MVLQKPKSVGHFLFLLDYPQKFHTSDLLRLRTNSRMLVDLCIKHGCGKLVLMRQKEREELAKDEALVLRNWGYFGLKTKIEYKCKMHGIEIIEE